MGLNEIAVIVLDYAMDVRPLWRLIQVIADKD